MVECFLQGPAVSKYFVNMPPKHVSLARPCYLEESHKVNGPHEPFC